MCFLLVTWTPVTVAFKIQILLKIIDHLSQLLLQVGPTELCFCVLQYKMNHISEGDFFNSTSALRSLVSLFSKHNVGYCNENRS